MVAADEVPPHDDVLVERLAADEQQPGRPARRAAAGRPAGAEVEQRTRGQRQRRRRRPRRRGSAPRTPSRVAAAGGCPRRVPARASAPTSGAVDVGGRRGPAELTHDHRDRDAGVGEHRQVRVMLEVRAGRGGPGPAAPSTAARRAGRASGSAGLSSEWEMPCPAVIRFSWPGRDQLQAADAVAVQHLAGDQPADRLQPGVRVRGHLHARPSR